MLSLIVSNEWQRIHFLRSPNFHHLNFSSLKLNLTLTRMILTSTSFSFSILSLLRSRVLTGTYICGSFFVNLSLFQWFHYQGSLSTPSIIWSSEHEHWLSLSIKSKLEMVLVSLTLFQCPWQGVFETNTTWLSRNRFLSIKLWSWEFWKHSPIFLALSYESYFPWERPLWLVVEFFFFLSWLEQTFLQF